VTWCCADADVADDNCYNTFNTAGRFNGHCGMNATSGGYLRCATEYVVVYVCCFTSAMTAVANCAVDVRHVMNNVTNFVAGFRD